MTDEQPKRDHNEPPELLDPERFADYLKTVYSDENTNSDLRRAATLIEMATDLSGRGVIDENNVERVIRMCKVATTLRQSLEESRKAEQMRYQTCLDLARGHFKDSTESLDGAKALLTTLLTEYMVKMGQDRVRDKELGTTASLTSRGDFEITDAAAVPDEYRQPHTVDIRKYMNECLTKSEIPEMPGVRFFQVQKAVVK